MRQIEQKSFDSKHVLKKHVAAIHIGAKLSLLQRKLVNALLYNAYDELLTAPEHTISSALLCEMIGFDSNNTSYLKAALKGLMETVVEFDVLEEDGESSWEAMVLLPYAKIKGGTCTYRYERALAEKLYHPDVYSKINLSVLREMNSTHALVLYENCYRYINVGNTAWWDVDVFRKLMAVDMMPSYKPFKALNRNVIQPAIKEVNKLSNIQVEMETRMKGRSVTGIRFIVKPNSQLSLMGISEDDNISSSPSYKSLIKEGISKTLARAWVIEHGDEYVLHKIAYANDQEKIGKIKSSKAGFLKSAIEGDYKSDKENERERKKLTQDAQDRKYNLEKRMQNLRDELRSMETSYRKYVISIIQPIFDNLESEEREAVSKDFSRSLKDEIYRKEFDRNGWSSRINFTLIRDFWIGREVLLPSQEKFAQTEGMQSPEALREELQKLEIELSQPYRVAS